MPQSRLIDVNTAFIRYRNDALKYLDAKDYQAAVSSCYCMNALLPGREDEKDYQITIDTDLFNEKMQNKTLATCRHCQAETEFHLLEIYSMQLKYIDMILAGKQRDKFWNCAKCGKVNKLSTTEIIKEKHQEPRFLHVVPSPPERKEGLTDRTAFHNRMAKWVRNFLYEVEEREAKMREDYLHRSQGEMALGDEVDTEGEELE